MSAATHEDAAAVHQDDAIVGDPLFLIPLVLIVVLIRKALDFLHKIVAPLAARLPLYGMDAAIVAGVDRGRPVASAGFSGGISREDRPRSGLEARSRESGAEEDTRLYAPQGA